MEIFVSAFNAADRRRIFIDCSMDHRIYNRSDDNENAHRVKTDTDNNSISFHNSNRLYYDSIWNYIFIQNANILSFKVLKKFFRHIIRMDGKFFKKYQTGDLMSRATEDVNAVSEAVDFGFLMLAEASLYLTLLISSMFVINPKISIIVLIPILIIPFGVDKLEKTIEKL